MKKLFIAVPAVLLLAALAAGGAWYVKPSWFRHTVPPSTRVAAERLVDIPVMMPEQDPAGLVILFSDKGGIDQRFRAFADAIVARGLTVLPVDLEPYRRKLDAADGECLYLGSDIENLAKEAIRTIQGDSYFHPVVAGIGEGGTLAYAAVADAPVATMAGAVALDPAPSLVTKLPTCPGATTTPGPQGGFAYALDAGLPSPATLVSETRLPGIAEPASAKVMTARNLTAGTPEARMDAAVDAIATIAAKDSASNTLPITDIPATGKPFALALFFSGDGGWRDLDMEIGNAMSTQGLHVVGIDTLRYFWSLRTPREIADDTVAIIERADPSGQLPVAIYGYSFGADTFPFAWPLLPKKIQDRIRFVGLLGTEHFITFQVTVGGWLGLGGDNAVVPAIARIPPERVLCVYGEEEDDTACTDPLLKGIETLKTKGGHHFDEDYGAMAVTLVAKLRARLP